MREYEIMLILPAEADEALVGTALDRITKVISSAGGEVGNVDRWGRRRFAYEIAKQTEGYYVVARFTAEPSTVVELERTLHVADEVLRHKVLLLPKPGEKRQRAEKQEQPEQQEASSPAPA